MQFACCASTLDEGRGPLRYWRRHRHRRVPEASTLRALAGIGFRSVDVVPSMLESAAAIETLRSLGLGVTGMAISAEAPEGASFGPLNPPSSGHFETAMAHAAEVGAGWVYLIPPQDRQALRRFAECAGELAERGLALGLKVCLEHFPATALPSVQSTLGFIRDVDHPNLHLLFDLGHAQISGEDPALVLPLVGDRLAYVHLNDNDARRDLHLGLTDGMQTMESLAGFFRVLDGLGYQGPLSLELNRALRNPLDAIRRSRKIVRQLADVS